MTQHSFSLKSRVIFKRVNLHNDSFDTLSRKRITITIGGRKICYLRRKLFKIYFAITHSVNLNRFSLTPYKTLALNILVLVTVKGAVNSALLNYEIIGAVVGGNRFDSQLCKLMFKVVAIGITVVLCCQLQWYQDMWPTLPLHVDIPSEVLRN